MHDYYTTETYRRVYNHTVMPTNGRALWEKTNVAPILAPNLKSGVGRPGGARRLEADEVPSKNKKKKEREVK